MVFNKRCLCLLENLKTAPLDLADERFDVMDLSSVLMNLDQRFTSLLYIYSLVNICLRGRVREKIWREKHIKRYRYKASVCRTTKLIQRFFGNKNKLIVDFCY